MVNWCGTSALVYPLPPVSNHIHTCILTGFYIDESLFPPSCILPPPHASIPYSFTAPRQPSHLPPSTNPRTLLLGPFCGRPACQYIVARQTGGVCSAAYLRGETVRVVNVHTFEGHIACDADTKSEVVVPLVYTSADGTLRVLGVLDLDCVAEAGFDDVDARALERIAELIVLSSEWTKE